MIDEYPFDGYLSPTGLAAATNGLRGGVVPGEAGEAFRVFAEPASASSLLGRFGMEVARGYLVVGDMEGLGQAREGDVLDVPEVGYSGTVRAIKVFSGYGDLTTVEVGLEWRAYGAGG